MRNSTLLKLVEGPMQWKDVAAQALSTGPEQVAANELVLLLGCLVDEGLVSHHLPTFTVSLTEAGRAAAAAAAVTTTAPAVVQRAQRPAPVAKGDRSPHRYYGEELTATCHRPGAYDFLSKPSRIGDEYVEHPTAYLAEVGGP